jgi:hypothetical protein
VPGIVRSLLLYNLCWAASPHDTMLGCTNTQHQLSHAWHQHSTSPTQLPILHLAGVQGVQRCP